MGKKSAPAQQVYITPDPPEPMQPIVFEMPETPPMPELQPMPAIEETPAQDWTDEELQAENEAEIKKANRLRVGRQSTILSSPLLADEDPVVKKPQLLGS